MRLLKPKNNSIDIIEEYKADYTGKIKAVDPKWVETKVEEFRGNQNAMENFAQHQAERIYSSYKKKYKFIQRITFVLWKHESMCTFLRESDYKRCKYGKCEQCPIHQYCIAQLEAIQNGTDIPTGDKDIPQRNVAPGEIMKVYFGGYKYTTQVLMAVPVDEDND